jgi:hypothetical protein
VIPKAPVRVGVLIDVGTRELARSGTEVAKCFEINRLGVAAPGGARIIAIDLCLGGVIEQVVARD